jgi:serine/threonine protein kinase
MSFSINFPLQVVVFLNSFFGGTPQKFEDFRREALTPLVAQEDRFYKMTLDNSTWNLPNDLSSLSISELQMEQINLVTSAIFKSHTNPSIQVHCKKTEKNLNAYTILAGAVPSSVVYLPFNIQYSRDTIVAAEAASCSAVYFSRHSPSMILSTRKQVGKGGERNVRLCFDMITQRYYVGKKTNLYELALISRLEGQQHRGLVLIHKIFNVVTSKGANKTKFLESCYDQTLTTLLQTAHLNSEQKFSLIEDLLTGLKTLHAMDQTVYIKLVNGALTTVPAENNTTNPNSEKDALICKTFHNDISPKNIVVRKQNDKWEAAMTDFGGAGILHEYGGASGYRSPELLNLMKKRASVGELILHNAQYGTARDIWAMGVLFVVILASPSIQMLHNVYSLPCIQRILKEDGFKDSKVSDLIQEEVDQDLKTLSNSFSIGRLPRVWELVGFMLRVSPNERMTADRAFERFQLICSGALDPEF